MSILDVSPSLQGVALGPQPGEQARMPATFGEVFQADWNEARLFAQSSAHATAKQQALTDYIDETRKNTGVDLTGAASHIIINSDWDGANQEVARLREKNPGVNLPPFSNDDLESRALAISRQARADADEMSRRERAFGGTAGGFFGSLAGGITDPINLVALPVAPAEGLPLLSYALRWGAIAAATQGASEVLGAPYHEQVQPGYIASGEPLANIGGAAVSGAALGAGGRVAGTLLGRAWGRVKTGTWSTAVRDAGNLAESEANIVHSNIYPGTAGEAAHRDALASASDQVIKGEPVDVAEHVTPEIAASGEQRLAPIMDARAAAIGADEAVRAERAASTGELAPELPFEATAKQAASEAAVARVADHVQQISQGDAPGFDVYHGSPHDFERFDISKIGTGEGAQSYGHGLYFAQSEAVAKDYAAKLAADADARGYSYQTITDDLVKKAGGSWESAANQYEADIAAKRTLAEKSGGSYEPTKAEREILADLRKGPPGNLYRVRINANPNHFLDWDKPLSEQSEHVQDVLRKIGIEPKDQSEAIGRIEQMRARLSRWQERIAAGEKPAGDVVGNLQRDIRITEEEIAKNESGQGLYESLNKIGEERSSTQILREAGIPGIKYLDQGSRNINLSKAYREHLEAELQSGDPERIRAAQEEFAAADKPNQTRNFVVFDDKLASITEKNGLPVMPREDAEKLAKMIVKADEPQAQAIVQAIQERPQTVADFPPRVPKEAPEPPATVLPPTEVAKTIGSPEHEAAIRADIDRARMTKDVKIPSGVDERGEPVFRSLDSAMEEVDGYKAAAEHIKACAAPQPEEPVNG